MSRPPGGRRPSDPLKAAEAAFKKVTTKADDFRLERDGDNLVLTFTPDGRVYNFAIDGDRLSEPSVSPAQVNAADYADDEVRGTASGLAKLALTGSPPQM
ncbi:hypothetical protein [Microvirga arsenatis]|uniref:Uncharacterized protein n=1 Tax=Microvirga arsenatis TaxID=2692265 RepID=A0ABW9YW31_9HYPH|nr:hypothetical protein [Microvirga arsenatis]NBJ10722.1 hypothetical protein [Microvirga arsenatis]NBJ24380.1 hypothetical protein [Microvirga arsenatis]